MMNHQIFWKIIEKSKNESQTQQMSLLKAALKRLDKEELIGFESIYQEMLSKAYNWDLWAAAYIINGGCSDDGFDYFCDWLISQGQNIYKASLLDPETLIGVATPWETDFEEFRYVMFDVMREVHVSAFPKSETPRPATPSGESWEEESLVEKYPELAKWIENLIPEPIEPIPPAQPIAQISEKPSFWHRLFGKKIQ